MGEYDNQIASIENLWKSIYETCSASPNLYTPHTQSLTIDEIGNVVLIVLRWIKSIVPKKRATKIYTLAKSILVTSLDQLIKTLTNISAAAYGQFPTLMAQLSSTLNALLPLTYLNEDSGTQAASILSIQFAEAYTELKNTSDAIEAEIEKCNSIHALKTEAETAANTISQLQQKITNSNTEIQNISNQITVAETAIKKTVEETAKGSDQIKVLAAEANEIKDKLDKYEDVIQQQIEKSKQDQERIDLLLPGATSAGLASSFANKAKSISKPKGWWLFGFVFSLLLICTTIFVTFKLFGTPTKDEFLSTFFRRLAFASPWIWLAWFCARNYGHLARLQESYSFKESVSRAFEGYKKQMAELSHVTKDANTIVLVEELSMNVINILSKDPLSIYDRKAIDETPWGSVFQKMFSRKETESITPNQESKKG